MNGLFVFTTLVTLCFSQVAVPSEQAVLVDFGNTKQSLGWKAVNDGVMGGRSVGKARLTEDGVMRFFGTLSLENNGGFVSIRSAAMDVEMKPEDGFRVRLKGDGRTYIFNLYPKIRRMAFSYRASLPSVPGQWTEVFVPLDEFKPTSFGRQVQGKGPLASDQISGIGFMLSDKNPGEFNLEIEWVKVEKPPADGRR